MLLEHLHMARQYKYSPGFNPVTGGRCSSSVFLPLYESVVLEKSLIPTWSCEKFHLLLKQSKVKNAQKLWEEQGLIISSDKNNQSSKQQQQKQQ